MNLEVEDHQVIKKIDVIEMERALGNLIENAVKYNPVGTKVTMGLYVESDKVRLEISDNGIGIPQADTKRIFDAFVRGDRTRKSEGTGLGLAITKQIIELHGGSITLLKAEQVGIRNCLLGRNSMIGTIAKYCRYIELFFLTVIFFGLAWTYEAIHFPRAYIFIIGFFLGYAFLIILRMNSRSNRINISAYIASILLVILLEYNSRYIINYFIHILYILLIIELAVSLERKKDLWIGALIVVAGMYKYVTLIQYKPAISTYAEATFFFYC